MAKKDEALVPLKTAPGEIPANFRPRPSRRSLHPEDPRTEIERFVRDFGGAAKVAAALHVNVVTVYTWLRKRATPSLPQAVALSELSGGALTCTQILDDTSPW